MVMERPKEPYGEERPRGELFGQLSREVRLWLRQEAAFAKAELSAQMAHAKKGAVLFAIGGVLGYVGFLAVVAAAIIALDLLIPLWLSALLIGVGCLMVAGMCFLVGYSTIKVMDFPRETISTVKEDVIWLKSQLKQ